MPQIIINITEDQNEKMLQHFKKPASIDNGDNLPAGFGFEIEYLFGVAELTVDIDFKKLELGTVQTNLKELLK